jgi:hypothetical protein
MYIQFGIQKLKWCTEEIAYMPTRCHNNTDFISIFRSFMLFRLIYRV